MPGTDPAAAAPAAVEEAREGSGSDTLLDLAEQALARGELDAAEERFARVGARHPELVRVQLGLAQVAQARGDEAEARGGYERVLAGAPDSVPALLGLAALSGPSEERALLTRALALDFGLAGAHARMEALTGLAPPGAPRSPQEALDRAAAHPYDPRALVQAGHHLLREGRKELAISALEKTVWLADRNPAAAAAALRMLPEADEQWARRRVIPVRVYVDQTLRREAAWRYRQRLVWLAASTALDPLLGVRFVPVSLEAFETGGDSPAPIEALFERLVGRTEPPPEHGILAGFTARGLPPTPGGKRGVAELLGRRMLVRLPPGVRESRVLSHEILHLFGAVHVADDLESLMNPAGDTLRLDRPNFRIAQVMLPRGFGPGGFERNILEAVDLGEAIAAYEGVLAVNLHFRRAGILEAMESARSSRTLAHRQVERATQLDPHLADVANVLARFLLADAREVEALTLFDLAADLYGRRSARGREAATRADTLQRQLEQRYGR